MNPLGKKIDRREFIALAAGTGAAVMSPCCFGKKMSSDGIVPKREFGNTGVKISKLCLGGGSFMRTDSEALLDEALNYGVDCWEIVSFTGKAYSEYFKKHPKKRKKVFLSGKIYSTDPVVMQKQLDKALKENRTSSIDFLAVHGVDNIKVLNNDVRRWADKVKKQKKIRFFGFCTHKNMAKCLNAAADIGWIDGIQTAYNYRMQRIKSMEDAIQKCHEKGVGIFAVKSMGITVQQKVKLQKLPLNEEKLNSLFAVHNISFEQAKLEAIWQNSNLTSVCSLMPNSAILHSNVSAAMDERPFNSEVKKLLADYADITGKYFCRRCGVCDTANTDKVPIFNIMEMLMYSRGYGASDPAAKKFEQIPIKIRNKIETSDYSEAEKICPQRIPIAQFMKEAYMEFCKRR